MNKNIKEKVNNIQEYRGYTINYSGKNSYGIKRIGINNILINSVVSVSVAKATIDSYVDEERGFYYE